MSVQTRAGGAWKMVRYVYTKVSGSWKNVGQIFVKVNGTWYPVWSYSWTTGSWGSCSADCGGGTSTRSVTCDRNDGYSMDDSLCTKYVGSKPSTSQSCNTQDCVECSSLTTDEVTCGCGTGNYNCYIYTNGKYNSCNTCILCHDWHDSTTGNATSCYFYWDGQRIAYTTGDLDYSGSGSPYRYYSSGLILSCQGSDEGERAYNICREPV